MGSQRALIVFSGGQDSTTCLFWARQKFGSISALTFAYGQRHIIEIESAKKIAELAGVSHEILDLGPIFSGMSALVDASRPLTDSGIHATNSEVPVPGSDSPRPFTNTSKDSGTHQLPSTFVPGRNILFLSLAASRAYVQECDAIVIGVSQEDYSGYPDCREQFVNAMELAISRGLDRAIRVEAPLMHLSKRETVELAVTLPGCMEALSFSSTCYNGSYPPCMSCSSCKLRAKGFSEAGVSDPLLSNPLVKKSLMSGSKG